MLPISIDLSLCPCFFATSLSLSKAEHMKATLAAASRVSCLSIHSMDPSLSMPGGCLGGFGGTVVVLGLGSSITGTKSVALGLR